MRLWCLSEVTLKRVREMGVPEVAVLPIGACEPHGLHLPYGADTYESVAIAERACAIAFERGAKVMLLPPIPYGVDSNLLSFPMTIHVRQETLNQIVRDIVFSLERHGVYKLVLLNGHGGNNFVGGLRDLYGQTKVWIFLVNWWQVGSDKLQEIFDEVGDHAGEMETSVCLAVVPNLVRLEDADEGEVRPFRMEALTKGWAWTTRPWERLTKNSGHGNPRKATAEKGERYLNLVAERIANFLVELARTPIDEWFPFEPPK
ncbi:creatininase family protein [Fervidibacter sacchari]|uniref:Creatinine amidohydrolase n=1 Tax=Candidatus Fervidibacter sacchari TaxID=1448929 RepID=A0ABT2ENL8_9BACT|nr:creatininase family protein [Candidatus Fervidibacter sacchari]MCS3919552.1 creatinine amidohydrolase [Candidatus Fervidibacter sacchari]WKU15276.1 creatininase family protein [Candidatus Fervidibacter sacchari]